MLIHYRMLLPVLIHASLILINALPILIHGLRFRLSAPFLNTLNRHDSSRQPIRIDHPRTLGSRQPIRIKHYVTPVVRQSESSTEKTHQLRQPIRIDYYVTRVGSQSESSITSPESSRLEWRSLLGSQLESARYSLS